MHVCSTCRRPGSAHQSATPDDASSCLQNAVHLAVAAAEEALKAAEATSTAKAERDSASAEQGGVEAMEVDEGNSAGGQVLGIKWIFRAYSMQCRSSFAPQPQLSICEYQTFWC